MVEEEEEGIEKREDIKRENEKNQW